MGPVRRQFRYAPAIVSLLALSIASGAAAQSPDLENLLLPSAQPAVVAPQAQQPQVAQQQMPGDSPLQPMGAAPQAYEVPPEPVQDTRDDDFKNALDAAFPLTPDQIRRYRGAAQENDRAYTAPLQARRPVQRSIRLSLKPGESTPVVRVEPGVVTALTFSDATGQAWPVQTIVVGNPNAYKVQSAAGPTATQGNGGAASSNIVAVSALQSYVPSNLAVTLVGHPVPILMSLSSDASDTDYRIDVQLASRGPNALQQAPSGVSLAPTDDSTLMAFLDGVPPTGAQKLRTTSSDVEVWFYSDMFYVRTLGEVISPGYSGRSSISGVNIFSMPESPVLLVSLDGRYSSVQIKR